MKFKIVVFLLGISFSIFAQGQESCDCSFNLNEIVTDIESNYPGYNVKTESGKSSAYQTVKKNVVEAASISMTRATCFYVIEKYLSFFKDNHIIFSDRKITPNQSLLNEIDLSNNAQDELTGIWRRDRDSLTVKIIKEDKSTYRGYILETPAHYINNIGKVHFELFGNDSEFRIRKYSTWLTTFLLRGRRLNQFIIEPDGIWEKVVEGTARKLRPTKIGADNKEFIYQQLGKNTYYLGIPAFDINEKKFDSLVVNQMIPKIIANKTEHLVIDLRNNVGGNSSFLSLIRLIYDKPFAIPGDYLFSTPAMISKYKKSADAGSVYHKMMLPNLVSNLRGFVQRDSMRVKLSEIYNYPKKVSILVNENCGSSTEYFLMIARQSSSKVKIFGRPTSGTLDYSELLSPETLSCEGYIYMRPTTKAFYTDTRPIDNIGIIPDVNLTAYPDDEWIDRVIRKQIQ